MILSTFLLCLFWIVFSVELQMIVSGNIFLFVQCEECMCWQHSVCMGLLEDSIPDQYICYICRDPPGNNHATIPHTKGQQDFIVLSSSVFCLIQMSDVCFLNVNVNIRAGLIDFSFLIGCYFYLIWTVNDSWDLGWPLLVYAVDEWTKFCSTPSIQ